MPLIITSVQHKGADFTLDPTWLQALWRMEDRHFWHAARNRWIEKMLRTEGVVPPSTLLDVGCGGGAVAAFLQRAGYRVTGIDTAEVLARKASQRSPEATFIVGDVAHLSPDAGPFAAICLLDVLEHLADPLTMLHACRRLANADTLFVVTVPALRSMHSVIDDLSGHKKRYEPGELRDLLRQAGLAAVTERGIFRTTLSAQRHARRPAQQRLEDLTAAERDRLVLADTRVPRAPINLLLRVLCAAERTFGFASARDKAGASLLAVGRLGRAPS
jgi:2-polyprenyl-3-methyl-5-hydroxy-6-metoxy-1,4-benzoquinol methylase